MCFSASASLTSGVVVGALGVATLPLVSDRRERLFASLPLVFGIHQILEGLVWEQLDNGHAVTAHDPAAAAWLFIAWVFLPVFVPLSVWRFEPDPRRRRLMLAPVGLGAAVGAYLLVASVAGPATVRIVGHHLVYGLRASGFVLGVPYVVATCGSLLVSSHRFVVAFGVVLTAAMGVTVLVASVALSSVWCFFAAILSVGLFVHYLLARSRGSDPVGLLST